MMGANTKEKVERTPEEKQAIIKQASDDLERIVAECGITALATEASPLLQTIKLADGMRRMRALMTQPVVEKYFMPLQGTPLGFVTDKDRDGGYSWDIVRDVTVEALMRGFRPIGNEFNVIAGRFYGAKAGFERIVDEFPGLTGLDYSIGNPQMVGNSTALVEATAKWSLHGAQHSVAYLEKNEDGIDTRIAIRVNSGMGPDAILGKATRKLFARIYKKLTRCSSDVVDMDPEDYVNATVTTPTAVTSAPEGRRMSLRSKPASSPANEPPHDPETGEVDDDEPEREPGMEG